VRWLVFFQDTNGLIFRSMAAVVGVSKKLDLGANSVCVPRTPGEAVGGICRCGDPRRRAAGASALVQCLVRRREYGRVL
jgi:hypothetical protein